MGFLYSYVIDTYWYRIKRHLDYLKVLVRYLDYLRDTDPDQLMPNSSIIQGNVMVGEGVRIKKGAKIGPNVTIGDGCVIEEGVRLVNCAVMDGAKVGKYSWIEATVIGPKCKIGQWCRIE